MRGTFIEPTGNRKKDRPFIVNPISLLMTGLHSLRNKN